MIKSMKIKIKLKKILMNYNFIIFRKMMINNYINNNNQKKKNYIKKYINKIIKLIQIKK